MQDFNKMTVSKLKEAAKSLGLSDYEKLKKAELLEIIMNHLNPETKKLDIPVRKQKAQGTQPAKAKKTSKAKPQNEKTSNTKKSDKKAQGSKVQELPLGVKNISELDSGEVANGTLEILPDGYGFIRSDFLNPGENDIYVAPTIIKNNRLRTGDVIVGPIRIRSGQEKFAALLDITTVNGVSPEIIKARKRFEEHTPIFPERRIHLERADGTLAMRVTDLISPIGMGQRGMIVSPPKAGKTTLIKDIAKSILENNGGIKLFILLIDERPEEVTDIRDTITDPNVEVVYSTFDEPPENHKKVAEMVMFRAKRYAESGRDVVILLDSITRLARAFNLVISPSGRTLSGGLDPNALLGPKKFFGAARNLRGSGSLTILATALVETGSRMDDVIFEEFKGTGNMELVLDRKMSERRIFPAIDMLKSGTRRDDLLLTEEERVIMNKLRKLISKYKPEDQAEKLLEIFKNTKTNADLISYVKSQSAL